MAFKAMKDYIMENQVALESRQNLQLISRVAKNSENILRVENQMEKMDSKIEKITNEMAGVVKKSEIKFIISVRLLKILGIK